MTDYPRRTLHVNTNKHWYSILNLLENYPIVNKRWQYANESFEYFFELDEQPETDPWGRKMRPWTRNGEGELLCWESFEPFGDNKGTYFRMTTIEKKAVSLWMYPSPKHPLYKT